LGKHRLIAEPLVANGPVFNEPTKSRKRKGRDAPSRKRAARLIGKRFPDGVRDSSELTNDELVALILEDAAEETRERQKLGMEGLPGVSRSSILRTVGRVSE
jgi:hypothetical protein